MKEEKPEERKNAKKTLSLPFRSGALLRVRRCLAARPSGQEEPREQDDVTGDQDRDREAQAAPRKVERFSHFFFVEGASGSRGEKTATRKS